MVTLEITAVMATVHSKGWRERDDGLQGRSSRCAPYVSRLWRNYDPSGEWVVIFWEAGTRERSQRLSHQLYPNECSRCGQLTKVMWQNNLCENFLGCHRLTLPLGPGQGDDQSVLNITSRQKISLKATVVQRGIPGQWRNVTLTDPFGRMLDNLKSIHIEYDFLLSLLRRSREVKVDAQTYIWRWWDPEGLRITWHPTEQFQPIVRGLLPALWARLAAEPSPIEGVNPWDLGNVYRISQHRGL